MKIGIILGTRPEIVKLSAIIRYCKKVNSNYFIIHTNQHYSKNMDAIFFEELELPKPKYELGIGSGSHGEMTGRMMSRLEEVLIKEKPQAILVQGDTNTVMAGALVATKLGIKVGHVEAGLRSYDRTMPEEINRIVTDHVADYLFCPTKKQTLILLKEGIEKEKIFVTGNTVVDAVFECSEIAIRKSNILTQYSLGCDGYILLTSHRPATVDVKKNLLAVLKGVEAIAKEYDQKIVFPIHPRTRKMIEKFKIKISKNFILIEPVGYLDMLQLLQNTLLLVTDSGGLQEEACILKKKCLVIRENTERPEAISVGGSVLVGNSDHERIFTEAGILLKKNVTWKNPFGDGKSGQRILKLISEPKK
jgi:UDP-N-acetylglucosamine 2-epimerase (non-hydrolysing)